MADGGKRRIDAIAGWVSAIGLPVAIVLAALPLVLPHLSIVFAPEVDAEDLGFTTMPAAAVIGYDHFVLFPTSRSHEQSLKCSGYRQVEIEPDLRGWLAVTEGNRAIPPGWRFVEDDAGFDCAGQWQAIIERLDREAGERRPAQPAR